MHRTHFLFQFQRLHKRPTSQQPLAILPAKFAGHLCVASHGGPAVLTTQRHRHMGPCSSVFVRGLWGPNISGRRRCWTAKVRFFFWLVMHDRCWSWTAERRRFRHGLQDSHNCVICDQASETMHHILLGCVFRLKNVLRRGREKK